jgi:CHAT domain-containing protein
VKWQFKDAVHHLGVAAAKYRDLAVRRPGQGHARRALDLSAAAVDRLRPGDAAHRRQLFDWAATGLICLTQGEPVPEKQVEDMLGVMRQVAGDPGAHGDPESVRRIADGFVDWWNSTSRPDGPRTDAPSEPGENATPRELVTFAQGLLAPAVGRGGKDLDRAIALLRRAHSDVVPGTDVAASAAHTLGVALLEQHRGRPGTLALGRAMDVLEREAEQQPPHSNERGMLLLELASCWGVRHETSGSGFDLEAATTLAREARTLLSPGTRYHREATRRLSDFLLRANAEPAEGLRLLREAADPQAGDDGPVGPAADWSDAAAERQLWDEALEAAELALRRVLLVAADQQVAAQTRLERLQQVRDFASHAAIIAARAGDPDRALRYLDTISSVGADREHPPQLPPEGCVLAHLCSPRDEKLLVLTVDCRGQVRPLWLPVSRQELTGRVGLAWLALANADGPAWLRQAVDELAQWLGTCVLRPVLHALRTRWLCLIPHGTDMGSLPLHAAWWPDPAAPDGRRYALDEALVTYANAAAHPGQRRTLAAPHSILAVADPQPTGEPPLPGARREAEQAVRHFARGTLLLGADARRAAVLSALPGSDVVHLAAHGTLDILQPLHGGISLAGGERLTMRDVLDQPLSGIRLMVLSACDMGQVGRFKLTSRRVLSLPDALLDAGVDGVVSSLWRAPDESSALLLSRFYELWCSGTCTHPADALRRAQQWLRDATNEELGGSPPAGAAARLFWARARPYQHPVHWAAFSYAGA